MNISSPAFTGDTIPAKYTCDGEGISPPLKISGVPESAASLVLICDDPDAPAGLWVHWIIWNIDPKFTEIAENSVPAGSVEGTTSFGSTGYGGPCPPSGSHRYFFKVYALDITIPLGPDSKIEDLIAAMQGHILDQAELVRTYGR